MKIYGPTKYMCDWCGAEAVYDGNADGSLTGWCDLFLLERAGNRDDEISSGPQQACPACIAKLGPPRERLEAA